MPVADDENEWVYVGPKQPDKPQYKLGVKFTASDFSAKGGAVPAWGMRGDVPLTYRGLVLFSNEKE